MKEFKLFAFDLLAVVPTKLFNKIQSEIHDVNRIRGLLRKKISKHLKIPIVTPWIRIKIKKLVDIDNYENSLLSVSNKNFNTIILLDKFKELKDYEFDLIKLYVEEGAKLNWSIKDEFCISIKCDPKMFNDILRIIYIDYIIFISQLNSLFSSKGETLLNKSEYFTNSFVTSNKKIIYEQLFELINNGNDYISLLIKLYNINEQILKEKFTEIEGINFSKVNNYKQLSSLAHNNFLEPVSHRVIKREFSNCCKDNANYVMVRLNKSLIDKPNKHFKIAESIFTGNPDKGSVKILELKKLHAIRKIDHLVGKVFFETNNIQHDI